MQCECLIVGGGPAGCALGIKLGGAGREVVLVEREALPRDKVCGEFLSAEALGFLLELAVDTEAEGAVPISSVRVFQGRTAVQTPLPFAARSLSRRRLDEVLLQRAGEAGVDVRRGCAVESVSRAGGAWEVRLASGDRIGAQAVFLASGKHDVRGWKRTPGRQNDLIAFKMHWRLTEHNYRSLQACVELVFFPGGYCGLELVEGGIANLCLLVRNRCFVRNRKSWPALLEMIQRSSPHFCGRLDGAIPLWPRPLALSAIPYGYIQKDPEGLWRVGDQFAVIPSFCGAGISLALRSAAVAAASYLQGEDQGTFRRRMASQVGRQVRLATALSRSLVAAPGQQLVISALGYWPPALARVASATRIPAG